MFNLAYRDELPRAVADELDNVIAKLTAFLQIAHNEDGTLIEQTTIAGMYVKRTLAQTIADAAPTVVSFERPVTPDNPLRYRVTGYDTTAPQSMLQPDSTGALTIIRPPETGLYLLVANIEWETVSTAGVRRVRIRTVNDTSAFATQETTGTTSVEIGYQNVSLIAPFGAEDNGFQIEVFQNRGGNVDVDVATGSTWVQIAKIADLS